MIIESSRMKIVRPIILYALFSLIILGAYEWVNMSVVSANTRGNSKTIFLPLITSPPAINVIVIFADDLGYGDTSPYGQEHIKTPRIAQMAEEGTLFTDFYSGAPHCPPARNSLMAGLHTGHTAIRFHGSLPSDTALSPQFLPRYLQNAGYKTGMFGKWGLGGYSTVNGVTVATSGRPETVGFDEFLGYMNHTDAHSYTLPHYDPNSTKHDLLWHIDSSGNTVEYPDANITYTHDLFVDKALEFIDTNKSSPFFLYLPFTLPHAEFYVPPDTATENLLGQYLNSDGTSIFPENAWPGTVQYPRPSEKPRATYAAMISRLDRDIGRILDTLETYGLDQNTIVMFSSDNGPQDTNGLDPASSDYPFNSSGGLRDRKYSLHEGGTRVPMIVWGVPSTIGGRVIEEPYAMYDVLPSILDIVGIAPATETDGISFAPALSGVSTEIDSHEFLYWETFTSFFKGQAVRMGDWKAVRYGVNSPSNPVVMYNLNDDISEQSNITNMCEIKQQMKMIMNREHVNPTTNNSGSQLNIAPLIIENCSN